MLILRGKGEVKALFFANFQKNKSNRKISLITKIILVILLLCVISNKTGVFNISSNITKMQSFNMDFIANELLMFSRLSLNYSIIMALGIICITAGVLLAITYITMSFSKETEYKENVKVYSSYVESVKYLHTNNIYLLNNKFIC